jgi:hypothetical protein
MIWVFLFSNEFFLKTARIVFDEKLITFVVLDYLRWQSPIRV